MSKSSLISRLRTEIRRRNYSYKTEQAYANWVVRYVKFHDLKHPSKMDEDEVVEYLNYLAEDREVAGSTQNQALCAILFLYEHVLDNPLEEMMDFKRAQTPKKLPVVLTPGEVKKILQQMEGTPNPHFSQRNLVVSKAEGKWCSETYPGTLIEPFGL